MDHGSWLLLIVNCLTKKTSFRNNSIRTFATCLPVGKVRNSNCMNIGIVCYPTFGGSGVVATELGKAMGEKGHQVHFISYNKPFKLDEEQENIFYHEVEISNYDLFEYPPYELSLTNKIVDVANSANLDLLHVHYAIPHAAAAHSARQILEAKGKKLPFITTLHGTDITLVGKNASLNEVITFAMNQSDILTTVSESLRKDTVQHFSIEDDIHVIPNFICFKDYCQARETDLRRKYADDDEKILMHISNFRPVKRVRDIVKVFAKVQERVKSKLILVGEGPDLKAIDELCDELDICDHVIRVGKLKETETILSIADIFLLTSETESFGLVALEAMASGVPVISTNTGGLPEVNVQGKTGFLSDVGDIDDMSKHAIELLEDETMHKQFRINAFDHAKKFDIKHILPRYEALYQSLLK